MDLSNLVVAIFAAISAACSAVAAFQSAASAKKANAISTALIEKDIVLAVEEGLGHAWLVLTDLEIIGDVEKKATWELYRKTQTYQFDARRLKVLNEEIFDALDDFWRRVKLAMEQHQEDPEHLSDSTVKRLLNDCENLEACIASYPSGAIPSNFPVSGKTSNPG